MSVNNKSVLISVLIIVITLVILVMGAAYAYFTNGVFIGSSKTDINTSAESVGIATLSAGKDLKISLKPKDMMQTEETIYYFATIDGIPSLQENSEVIATASVKGNGIMNCQYKLNVSVSGTNNMYDVFKNMESKSVDQLVLTLDGSKYDFFDIAFPTTISGTINGISEQNSKDIYASFMLANRSDVDQTKLKATDIKLSFSVAEFKCNIVG